MNNKKEMVVGLVLLFILISMIYWGYKELLTSYENFEISNIALSTILDRQSQQIWDYEYTIEIVSKRLQKAEALLKEYKRENRKLRDKIDLLDAMDDLRDNIARLKNENWMILEELEALKKRKEKDSTKVEITSRQEGRELIAKHRQNLQSLIHDIKRQMHELKVAQQHEMDRIESQLGNNGYLIRDGKNYSVPKSLPVTGGTVKIDVKFLP